MEFHQPPRRPATAFTRTRKSQSVIIDKYKSKQKLINSEPIQRPTPEGMRENFLKLSQILEEDKINQNSFVNREKSSNDKTEQEKRQIYHDFCINFSSNKSNFKKKFEDVKLSAKKRSQDLYNQTQTLENLERETYRLEMNLPDPNFENKK